MYTELVLGVDLFRNTPEEVIDILEYMIEGNLTDVRSGISNHPLFKTNKWRSMLRCYSIYFGGDTISKLVKPSYSFDMYHLSVRSNIENYESEIELFLNWLNPYIDTNGFIGYMKDETFDDPYLIYHGLCNDNSIYLYSINELNNMTILNDKWLFDYIK